MSDLVPIVCDKRDIEVRHFTTGRVGSLRRCDLLIVVNGEEYRMFDSRTVFDFVAALCVVPRRKTKPDDIPVLDGLTLVCRQARNAPV